MGVDNRPGMGMGDVTLSDVAALAGVAVSTASRALNNQKHVSRHVRARVFEAAKKLNYSPNVSAKRLVTGRTHAVRLYLIQEDPISPSTWAYYLRLIEPILQTVRSRDYSFELDICDLNDLSEKNFIVTESRMRHFDGVLLFSPWPLESWLVQELVKDSIAFMIVDSKVGGRPVNSVRGDNADAVHQMVQHLHQLGHREMAMISGPRHQAHMSQRMAGYRSALRRNGILYDPDLVEHTDFTIEGGYQAFLELFRHRRPTAIICGNDHLAAGAINAARSLGLQVPQDVSITGFDDGELARVTEPSLTTIREPLEEVGIAAAKGLLRQIEGGVTYTQDDHILPCKLIIRNSTAPPRSQLDDTGSGSA